VLLRRPSSAGECAIPYRLASLRLAATAGLARALRRRGFGHTGEVEWAAWAEPWLPVAPAGVADRSRLACRVRYRAPTGRVPAGSRLPAARYARGGLLSAVAARSAASLAGRTRWLSDGLVVRPPSPTPPCRPLREALAPPGRDSRRA